MLDGKTIGRLAMKHQTTEVNIAREYCQHLFLSAFYQHEVSEKVLFKGGTALRFAFQSPRFSEDLDFSGFRTNLRELETLLLDTAGEVQKIGVGVEIGESKKTSGGYLSTLHLAFSGHKILILLEISLRKQNDIRGEILLITSDFAPPYPAIILPEELLVEEKLKALLSRAKPRDYFDLYFMLRKGLIKPGKQAVLKEVKLRLSKGRLMVEQELKDFLPRSQQKLVRNFHEVLLREISRYV